LDGYTKPLWHGRASKRSVCEPRAFWPSPCKEQDERGEVGTRKGRFFACLIEAQGSLIGSDVRHISIPDDCANALVEATNASTIPSPVTLDAVYPPFVSAVGWKRDGLHLLSPSTTSLA
jgi:hypothetical protein